MEALSYGVPVIITNTVGAKDILADGAGIVVHNTESDELYEVIKNLNAKKLAMMNQAIVDKQEILLLPEMTNRIMEKCYK